MYNQFEINGNILSYTNSAVNNDYYESHCHTKIETILVYCGNVDITIEDRKYNISKPCVVFFLPTVYHSVYPNKNSLYERITCQFSKTALPKEIEEKFLERIKENPVIESDEIYSLQIKLKDIILHKDKREYSCYISAVLCELFYLALNDKTKNVYYEPDTTMGNILSYINNNLDKITTIDDISKALFISSSTISHLFKKHMSTSVKQYILQKKMLLAEKYLENGFPAVNVAQMLGYNNYSNFCNIYKKISGKFPKLDKPIR